jgi:hypothetical protein
MTASNGSRLPDLLVLGTACLSAIGATAWVAWLLWRWVPTHAALFAGLTVDLPREAQLVIAVSNWFVRLVPIFIILAVGFTRQVVWTLVRRASLTGEYRAVHALAGALFLVAIMELAAGARVVRDMRAGCFSASTDPRFQDELASFQTAGESPCSISEPE